MKDYPEIHWKSPVTSCCGFPENGQNHWYFQPYYDFLTAQGGLKTPVILSIFRIILHWQTTSVCSLLSNTQFIT